MGVLAMFPLGSVLLPGEILPLHVFEPRYRQLVIDLLADDVNEPEFGVTLIERGHEVGGGDQRAAVGTVARVVQVEAFEGGRYGVIALGTRRLRVNSWLPDDPYPLADVDDLPDLPVDGSDAQDLATRVAAALSKVERVHRLAVELGDVSAGRELTLGDDPVLATYQLASHAPLGPADRYRVLGAATPHERLALLDACLDDVEALLKFRAS